jgi:hypothetical protein
VSAAKKKINATLAQLAIKAIRFALISAYFFWWSYKTERRHKAKVASLGILSISTLLLGGELLVEAAGAERIAGMVEQLGALGPAAEWVIALRNWMPLHYVLFALILIAVGSLIFHHMHEAWKPGYEYLFVKRLSDVLLSNSPKEKRITEALAIFHSAFERAGIKHVSVYTKDSAKNELCIATGHVHPLPKDLASYAVPLPLGTGVAGSVFAGEKDEGDGIIRHLPRYVPRLSWFFGRVPFPHAVKFAFVVEADEAGSAVKHLELGNEDIEPDVFFSPSGSPKLLFKSLLSVPMLSTDLQCVGVLNFDFDSLDPLEKSDIAMAVVFGLVLGREI